MNNKMGLKYAREQHDLSINEFANLLGIDTFTLREWENGYGILTLDDLKKITKTLNVSSNFILFNEQREPLKIGNLNEEQRVVIKDLLTLMKK